MSRRVRRGLTRNVPVPWPWSRCPRAPPRLPTLHQRRPVHDDVQARLGSISHELVHKEPAATFSGALGWIASGDQDAVVRGRKCGGAIAVAVGRDRFGDENGCAGSLSGSP